MNGDSGVRVSYSQLFSLYYTEMNDFKFFKGETISEPTLAAWETVPVNYRIESVDSIYYNPLTFIPTRRVYCRHIIDTDDIFSFPITDTHWLWDYNE